MTSTTASPPVRKPAVKRLGDRIFSGSALTAGTLILATLAAVAAFLVVQGFPALTADPDEISLFAGGNFWTYVAPLAFGTVWAAFLALLMAIPVSVGIALFISHYAPRRLAQALGYIIDLLAAVPSVVFGLWGANVLAPAIQPVYAWLTAHLGWFPLFAPPVSGTGRTLLTAAIVLAVMVLPVITALCRELFLQTPVLHEEAALALGATRWEMIRMAVLPFGRSGIVSASMLGLGRALGETMAVAMVLSASGGISFKVLTSANPGTIAANIALSFPEAFGLNVDALIATGLLLFAITLIINMIARWIVARRKEFSGAN
ncbi:phosphate ABC transporter permease subunit PstC [Microbacterium sp. MPKO10]|uniref:phosphate ABC transporter permease subunit PstC n=1 Tax=Microbacterium sp. MPKO10 TaxID=2989818 RepID=UPI00223558F0|nr:phosphate ABC transporter permease subunit PstC [Microbacterium sp. MPKO10]MCW4458542.1 phosphate ABC transporter permease subunit PstC [Microbacterium sp. MPKO10]